MMLVHLQEVDINGIKFWCYNAGHVLGAAMFMIEIAGVKVSLYFYCICMFNHFGTICCYFNLLQ